MKAPPVVAALRQCIGSGNDYQLSPADALAIVDHVAALTLENGRQAAQIERMKGRDDEARRKLAEAKQIAVSADNVQINADKKVREHWRNYQEARAVLALLVTAIDKQLWIDAQRDVDRAFDVSNADGTEIIEGPRPLTAARELLATFDLPPRTDDKIDGT